MARKHQTSDVQLHIGEPRDSGFDAEPVIGPRVARTRWHRPGMTGSGSLRLCNDTKSCPQTCLRDLATQSARAVDKSFAPMRAWGMPGARCTRGLVCTLYWWKAHEQQRVHRNHPAFPHAMVLTVE